MSIALLAVLVSRPASGAPIPHPDELDDAMKALRGSLLTPRSPDERDDAAKALRGSLLTPRSPDERDDAAKALRGSRLSRRGPDEREDAAKLLRASYMLSRRGSVANANTEVSGLPDLASQGVCTCFRKSSRLQSAAR
jgi:hypothetical protein